MKKWLRRIRGALGIGLTWAAAWALVGPLSFIALVGAMFGLDRVGVELLLGTVGFFALSMATIAAFLGSGSAAGSLALARRSGEGKLLGGEPEGAAVQLTEKETRALPASAQ